VAPDQQASTALVQHSTGLAGSSASLGDKQLQVQQLQLASRPSAVSVCYDSALSRFSAANAVQVADHHHHQQHKKLVWQQELVPAGAPAGQAAAAASTATGSASTHSGSTVYHSASSQ
jgi:hypothetical protein